MKKKKTNRLHASRKRKRAAHKLGAKGRRHRHRYMHAEQQGIAVAALDRAYKAARAEYLRTGEALFRAKNG